MIRVALATIALAFLVTGLMGCGQKPRPSTFPDRPDVEALVKPRPKIPPEAAGDPSADAVYRGEVRSWEDGFIAAGRRVCVYLKRAGMDVDCGK